MGLKGKGLSKEFSLSRKQEGSCDFQKVIEEEKKKIKLELINFAKFPERS